MLFHVLKLSPDLPGGFEYRNDDVENQLDQQVEGNGR
jgi:hypothetical protein